MNNFIYSTDTSQVKIYFESSVIEDLKNVFYFFKIRDGL